MAGMCYNTHIMKKVLGALLLLVLVGCLPYKTAYIYDISQYDFQDGDILLQHIPSQLCSVIADITESQYSHCGMIVYRGGRPYVLEAIGPVRYTSISTWLSRGARGRFTQLRPKNLSKAQIAAAIKEAQQFLGRPYDIQYELDDEKIYCSELTYKAYLKGCGTEIGEKELLKSMKWKQHEDFIRYLAGGELPLDRLIVTPESLTRDSDVKLVYSTFPPRADEPVYDTSVLTGTWQGEYTIKGLTKAVAMLTLAHNGQFRSGTIRMPDGNTVKITSFSALPFSKTRRFVATLTDVRGIKATLRAQIRDQGKRIIGTWKDNLGYKGVFSFEKDIPE